MSDTEEKKNVSNRNLLIQYASIGAQIVAGLFLFVFVGKWIDSKTGFSFPVFIWLLPLVFIIGIIIKAVRDTSTRKK